MRFATLASLLTDRHAPMFIEPFASASEAAHRLRRGDARALIVVRDAPPVCVVCDRQIVDFVVAPRRDPDAMTALELGVPTESFDGATTLDTAWNRVNHRKLSWVTVQDGGRVIGVLSRTEMLEWVLRSQEEEFDSAINTVRQFALSNRRPS